MYLAERFAVNIHSISNMSKPKTSVIEMSFDELFEGATDTTLLEKVAKVIRKKSSEDATDAFVSQRDQDWSILANQVVGNEQL